MTLSRSGIDLEDFTFRRNNNAGELCVQCQSQAKIDSKGAILNDRVFQGCQTSSCPGFLGKIELQMYFKDIDFKILHFRATDVQN